MNMRGLDRDEVRKGFVFSDPDAEYAATFEIDLDEVRPMVALPGDPRNGIPIDELTEEVKIDAAYGGSCTGGKMADMDMYAAVLQNALKHGKRVAPGVHLYLQFGSQKIKQYAREKGYIEIFTEAGAELIDPSCGACINAGPGASKTAETVTVSAQNRNFPGRSGPGKLYLASPYVVAASAIAGKIVEPDEILVLNQIRARISSCEKSDLLLLFVLLLGQLNFVFASCAGRRMTFSRSSPRNNGKRTCNISPKNFRAGTRTLFTLCRVNNLKSLSLT